MTLQLRRKTPDPMHVALWVGLAVFLAIWLCSCGSTSRYGFTGDADQGADTAADCIVVELEAQGLTQPGVAAKALRSAGVSIVYFDHPITERPGWERAGSTDGHIVYTLRDHLPHELVHVILCATQLGQCDSQHQARAWWVPVTEPAKRCWADSTAR